MQCTCCLFLQILLGWKDKMMSSLCLSQCHCCMWLVPPSDAKDQGLFIKILVGLSLQFLSQQTTSIYFALLWKGILDHSTNLLKKFCPPHIQVFYRYMNKWEVNILKERDYISRSPDLTAERRVNADWESGLKEWSTFCIKKSFLRFLLFVIFSSDFSHIEK